jgi:hypothetical protein
VWSFDKQYNFAYKLPLKDSNASLKGDNKRRNWVRSLVHNTSKGKKVVLELQDGD